tara:strand:+ start:524 stop:718 length:195 start_codon:yes stop_codon:yes gene_type:complete
MHVPFKASISASANESLLLVTGLFSGILKQHWLRISFAASCPSMAAQTMRLKLQIVKNLPKDYK